MNNLLIILDVINQLQARIDVEAKITFSNTTNHFDALVIEISTIVKKGKLKGQCYAVGESITKEDLLHLAKGHEYWRLGEIIRCFNKGCQEKENQP